MPFPLDSPLFAGGAVLAVPVLSFRVAGERVPVVPGVTVLGAVGVGRMGRAEHHVVAADGPALSRYPFPQVTFAVEMDDVLLPGSQIAHGARNGQALKGCDLTAARDRRYRGPDWRWPSHRWSPESMAIVCAAPSG